MLSPGLCCLCPLLDPGSSLPRSGRGSPAQKGPVSCGDADFLLGTCLSPLQAQRGSRLAGPAGWRDIFPDVGHGRAILTGDGQALLGCLPSDGGALGGEVIRRLLGWDQERYAATCRGLEAQGYVLSGQDRGGTICRDLSAVPPEFRPACGHPGARVTVRQVPVTVPHAACDLTGVALSYPGHGGATVPRRPSGIGNSKGFVLEVDPHTLDVTIWVTGSAGTR